LPAALLAAVDARQEELVRLLGDLVRAASLNPPGDTRAPARVALDHLEQAGVPARAIGSAADRPSVLAGSEAASVDLLLLSHLDTVPLGDPDAWSHEPFGAGIHAGRLYGRGAADAKGSAAAMLLALRVLGEHAPELAKRVRLALVADEETGGAGAEYLLSQGRLEAANVVVGETSDNEVAIAEKGVAWLRLTTQGRTAHASIPASGINAAEALVRWLAELDGSVARSLAARRHPLLSPPTLTLTSLTAGVATNVVPDQAQAILDRRTLPDETLAAVEGEMLAAADRAGTDFGLDVLVWAAPFETPPDTSLVQAALAARRGLDLPAATVGYRQASDGRFFGARGIPTIVLGPGLAQDTHVPDESVPLQQVVEAAKLYLLTAWNLFAHAPADRPGPQRP
jgi:acetylornithine deacetylase/succinyl-diaminopimelate desuccinylase family protein